MTMGKLRGGRSVLLTAMLSTTLGASAFYGSRAAADADTGAGSFVETPHSTQGFLNGLGINTHISLAQGPYRDVKGTVERLHYLGIRHVRDDVRNTSASIPRYKAIVAAGNKLTLMLSPKAVPDPGAALTALEPISRHIDVIEGANEIDVTPANYAGASGVAGAQAWQHALYRATKAHPRLAESAKVLEFTYGPAVPNPAAPGEADATNVHIYPLWKKPPYQFIADAAKVMDIKNNHVFMTETNYPTSVDKNKGVPEDIQAKYLLDDVFDCFVLGFDRTYIYQLSDTGTRIDNQEDNFGLFRLDGSPKPAATAIHNLTEILAQSGKPGDAAPPDPLAYSLVQPPPSAATDAARFHYLMAKPDGTYMLVLWAEPPLYKAPPPKPNPVTVAFSAPHKDVEIFDPLAGTGPVDTYHAVARVTLNVVDHPLIIEISKD